MSTTRLTNVDVNSSAPRLQVLALDSLQLPTCRFVKIDAEGMAPDVVVGMVNTIQHCRPVLFIQCENVDDAVFIRNAVHWKDYSFFLVRCAEYRSGTFAENTENLADFGDETAILCVPYEIRAMLIENNEWIEVNPFDDLHFLTAALMSTPRCGDATPPDRDPVWLRNEVIGLRISLGIERELAEAEALQQTSKAEGLGQRDPELERRLADNLLRLDYQSGRLAMQAELLDQLETAKTTHADEVSRLKLELKQLYASRSWRVTAPIRWAKDSARSSLNTLRHLVLERLRAPHLRPPPVGQSSAEAHTPLLSEPQASQLYSTTIKSPAAPSLGEWEALCATRDLPAANPVIDVLVPVYGGHNPTMRCLFSVLSSQNQTAYQLVVIDDCSPEAEIQEALHQLSSRKLIELHRTPKNIGFVGACNFGMRLHSERDVILLNSDTEVFGDWIDRLHAAAMRTQRAATVTPFTNNGEICSYPFFVRDHRSPLELSDCELDKLAARVNAYGYVEIPTGVGFCMYIRRDCLNSVGFFDEASFGRGYGEENDFCQRAAAAGWHNILAPNVFVRHYGGASFGISKKHRMSKALATVERLHPGYSKTIATFVQTDPVRRYREALDIGRLESRARGKAVLYVTHSWGGGTERHAQDLARVLEADGTPVFFCRVDTQDPERIRVEDACAAGLPNLPTFSVSRDLRQFAEFVRRIGIRHMHIHHLAGFPDKTSDFLRAICRSIGIQYDVTLHDYMAICPRMNLVDAVGVYCGEPPIEICQKCIDQHGSPFGRPSVWMWRECFMRFLSGARTIFVPNTDVKQRLSRYMPEIEFSVRPPPPMVSAKPDPARVNSYLSHLPKPSLRRSARRIAVVGAIGVPKGSRLLVQTAEAALAHSLPLEFVIIGYTDRDAELSNLENVTVLGRYADSDAHSILTSADAAFAWFPAVCPETYSYTLSIALEAQLYPVAFEFGAIAERIRMIRWGQLLRLGLMFDPPALAKQLSEICVAPFPDNSIQDIVGTEAYPAPLSSYYGLSFASGGPTQAPTA